MKCPVCDTELRITKVRHVLENDDSPEKETKLYVEQELSCVNKGCTNFSKVVETVKNQIPLG